LPRLSFPFLLGGRIGDSLLADGTRQGTLGKDRKSLEDQETQAKGQNPPARIELKTLFHQLD